MTRFVRFESRSIGVLPGTEIFMADASFQKQFPGADSAFSFVIPSYQLMLSRFEAADERLTTLIATVSAVALGAPTLAKGLNPNISFRSVFFVLGVVCFL